MNPRDFEPARVPADAPPLAEGQEWLAYRHDPSIVTAVQTVPEDAPPLVREGLVRRRIQAVDGACPCGARMQWATAPEQGVVNRSLVQHSRDCPAGDAVFLPALLVWRQEQDGER